MRRRLVAAALAAALIDPAGVAPAQAVNPEFERAFARQYEQLRPLAPDMVVEEMRLRVESVAARGSRVGAASNDRRVRGFESALLRALQQAQCAGGRWMSDAARPAARIVPSLQQAAQAQQLALQDGDLAPLAALAQRVLDTQGQRLCTLRSLDEVR